MAQHERAESRIIRSKRDQAAAQLALLNEQLAHTRITAPFDGLIVSGDLSQSLGAPVERARAVQAVPLRRGWTSLHLKKQERSAACHLPFSVLLRRPHNKPCP